MKDSSQYDFPILAWRETWEYADWGEFTHPPEMVALFEGIYRVILNHCIDVVFAAVDYTQPPPAFPANLDKITTRDQALWLSLTSARYGVVPLPASRAPGGPTAGELVDHPVGDDVGPTRVLSVGHDEFSEFCSELHALSEEVSGLRDTRRCSELSGYRVVDFLRTRIADADFLTNYQKWLLGRGPRARTWR